MEICFCLNNYKTNRKSFFGRNIFLLHINNIYWNIFTDLLFSLMVSSATVLSFVWLLRYSLIKLPKTFTIGESIIATQSVVLFSAISLLNWILESPKRDDETFFIHAIIFVSISAYLLFDLSHYLILHLICSRKQCIFMYCKRI